MNVQNRIQLILLMERLQRDTRTADRIGVSVSLRKREPSPDFPDHISKERML